MKRPPKPGETIYVRQRFGAFDELWASNVVAVISTKIRIRCHHPSGGQYNGTVQRFDEGHTWFRAGRDADAAVAMFKLSGAPPQR